MYYAIIYYHNTFFRTAFDYLERIRYRRSVWGLLGVISHVIEKIIFSTGFLNINKEIEKGEMDI